MFTLKDESRDRIKLMRKKTDMTIQEVADILKVSKGTVQRWESGNIKTIRQEHLAKLAQIWDVSPTWLAGWDNEDVPTADKYRLPVIGRVPAGTPISAVEFIEGYIDIPKGIIDRFGRSELFALRIVGDSMNKFVPP